MASSNSSTSAGTYMTYYCGVCHKHVPTQLLERHFIDNHPSLTVDYYVDTAPRRLATQTTHPEGILVGRRQAATGAGPSQGTGNNVTAHTTQEIRSVVGRHFDNYERRSRCPEPAAPLGVGLGRMARENTEAEMAEQSRRQGQPNGRASSQ